MRLIPSPFDHAGESTITDGMRPRSLIRSIDAEIAALAATQHGVVSLPQLAAIGLSPRAVSRRVGAGRLHRIHRGVFAVGHPRTTREGRWTIFDLASVFDRHGLSTVIREAEIRQRSESLSLPDLLERHSRMRGSAMLKEVLADLRFGAGVTRGELEQRFQRFLAEEGLPAPELNVPIHLGDRFIVADCVWRDCRVIVELDGHHVHDRPIQSDSDKERDRDLLLIGWRVIRVTWRHLDHGRARLAADLRRILGSDPR